MIGVKIIRMGRNVLKVVQYFVVIPLHPLRRGTSYEFSFYYGLEPYKLN